MLYEKKLILSGCMCWTAHAIHSNSYVKVRGQLLIKENNDDDDNDNHENSNYHNNSYKQTVVNPDKKKTQKAQLSQR